MGSHRHLLLNEIVFKKIHFGIILKTTLALKIRLIKLFALTLSWLRSLSYGNQSIESIDLLCKSMDWFLCFYMIGTTTMNQLSSKIDSTQTFSSDFSKNEDYLYKAYEWLILQTLIKNDVVSGYTRLHITRLHMQHIAHNTQKNQRLI